MRERSRTRGARFPRILCSKFLFDQPVQMVAYCSVVEALDDFVQKTGDEQALGNFCRNAAGAEVKELVFFDLSGSCTVGATDVVGKDFQAGH